MEVGVRQELKGENVAWQTSGDQLRERELADAVFIVVGTLQPNAVYRLYLAGVRTRDVRYPTTGLPHKCMKIKIIPQI